jgi:uncharacterized protein (DUF2141 family)
MVPKTFSHRMRRTNVAFGGAALAVLLLVASPAAALDLKLIVAGVRSSTGSIMIGLYDSEAHYESALKNASEVGLLNETSRLVGISMRAIRGTQSVVFTGLAPGPYAIIVFHDENDNGKLDTNFFGVPVEGYGFSNNAKAIFGSPAFDEVAVTLDRADKLVTINLIYRAAPRQD